MTRYAAAAVLGLAVVIALVAWQGVDTLVGALAVGGWRLVVLPVYFLLVLAITAVSWTLLLPPDETPPMTPGLALYLSSISHSVNFLLPVGMVGGEAVRALLMIRRRRPAATAIASQIADKTVQVATQVAFAVLGLLLLVVHGVEGAIALPLAAGVVALAVALVAFYWVQRRGVVGTGARWISRLFGPERARRLRIGADDVDRALQECYDRRVRFHAALALRFGARLVWAGEVVIALALLGHPLGALGALILESLTQAARGAGFLVPGGLGIQEGGVVIVGVALGLPIEICLALALVKRGRELAVGLPVLGLWQLEEARHWSSRHRGQGRPGEDDGNS